MKSPTPAPTSQGNTPNAIPSPTAPEFPTWIILTVLVAVTLVSAVTFKKLLRQK